MTCRVTPHHRLAIQLQNEIRLTPEVETVLQAMFRIYDRVVVEVEFSQGWTDARVFQIRPLEAGGKDYLPVVVKTGPIGLIRREWQAYQHWVAGTIPSIARLEAPPTFPADCPWGGLQYSLVGGDVFRVESLADYCRQARVDELRRVLRTRLFKLLRERWWLNHRLDYIQMQSEYDPLLPVNLLLKPGTSPPSSTQIHALRPNRPIPGGLVAGDWVHLQGFQITKIEREAGEQKVTLNLPVVSDGPGPASYRLGLVCEGETDFDFQEGRIVDSLYGEVIATRHDLLLRQASKVVAETVNLNNEQLTLPDGLSLPNPLRAYPNILQRSRKIKLSTIHGDLHLDNILVDPDTGDVRLIDFAYARQGYVLHDLLQLEMSVVTEFLPFALVEARLPPQAISDIYRQLDPGIIHPGGVTPLNSAHPALKNSLAILMAIREAARDSLFNSEDWTEYYEGLALHLLRALKFKDLDEQPGAPLPKQLAFWGAATALMLASAHRAGRVQPARPKSSVPNYLGNKPIQPAGADPPSPMKEAPVAPKTDQLNFIVGDVIGSHNAIGPGAQVIITHGSQDYRMVQVFEAIYQRIEVRSEDPNVEKGMLIELVRKIQQEAVKGEQANAPNMRNWLQRLAELAPDISRATIAGLLGPASGVAPTVRQIAARAGRETDEI